MVVIEGYALIGRIARRTQPAIWEFSEAGENQLLIRERASQHRAQPEPPLYFIKESRKILKG